MKIAITRYDEQTMISIENDINMKVNLFTLGASVYSLKIDNKNMICTPKNLEDYYRPDIYHGKTIGAIANRVKNGLVIIDGDKYYMDPNEEENVLHGGFNCLSNQTFEYNIKKHKDYIEVIFLFHKHEYIDSLPGNISYKISYIVYKGINKIGIKFVALSDINTCISLTNHMYFSLGENSIKNLSLQIKSSKFIEPNKNDLTPSRIRKIIPSLDFNEFKKISKNINDRYLQESRTKGYDHAFKLDYPEIVLKSSKYKLTINTDYKFAQIYSDNYSDEIEMLGTRLNKNRCLAIEPEDNLLKRPVCKKYVRHIAYTFENK